MGEIIIQEEIFIAPCKEENPIKLYRNDEGYPYNCSKCGKTATLKVLFLSPKYEVEGFFGPKYFCNQCVPDIKAVAANQDNYCDVLYGTVNNK
ncbi:MAG: hypothetical protein V1810_05075 [Candidatus Beckwithbacteria bacterium]